MLVLLFIKLMLSRHNYFVAAQDNKLLPINDFQTMLPGCQVILV